MKAEAQLEEQVKRWVAAGLIEEAAGQRILAHESHQERKSSLGYCHRSAVTSPVARKRWDR